MIIFTLFYTGLLILILECENGIPSTCSNHGWTTCPGIARFCEQEWSFFPNCRSTPGLVKDNCKVTCRNCNGK